MALILALVLFSFEETEVLTDIFTSQLTGRQQGNN